ncbi:TPA: hypothetical protein ACH3X1_010624 [Trebouxia sp. C0004]
MQKNTIWTVPILLLALLRPVFADEPKGVTVSLRVKWPGTSVLLEAAEFLASENSNAFWSFIETWQEPNNEVDGSCWGAVYASASQHLSNGTCMSLQQALAARQYTAKVEMLRNLAEIPQGSCCQVELAGQVFTEAGQLEAALQKELQPCSEPQLYAFDHIYSSDPQTSYSIWHANNATAAVLYGTPGTACFQHLHKLLKDAVTRQYTQGGVPLTYAVRPMLLEGCPQLGPCSLLGTGEVPHLAGYGVEMAIKNMEYSALDDSQVAAAKQAQQEAGGLEGGPGEVKGFLLGRLLERKPELEQELLTFRDHLLAASSSSSDQTLKVWDLKDLGLQASQRIAQAGDPLRLLTDISQNFPTLAASLSRLPANASLAAEVRTNQRSLPAGANVMLLNGLPVDVTSLELYQLMDRISAEVRLTDMLKTTELQAQDIQALLQLRASSKSLDSSSIRIDLAPYSHVHWLNNLEKDKKRYRGFSRTITDLLIPSFPGNLPSIARNVFNAVFVVDLGSAHGIGVAEAVVRAIGSRWPVRLGLLPIVPEAWLKSTQKGATEAAAQQATSVSSQAAQAMQVLDSTFGAAACLAFLSELLPKDPHANADEPATLTSAQVERAFTEAWETAAGQLTNPKASPDDLEVAAIEPEDAWQQLQDSTGLAAGAVLQTLEATRYAHSKGLVTADQEGSLWLNGLVFGDVLGGPQQALMRGIFAEMQTLQEHVYYQAIQDDTPDILAELLRLEGALQRYNPRILEKPSSPDRHDVRQYALDGEGDKPTGGWLSQLGYLYPPGAEDTIIAITHWVCVDPNTKAGQGLLLAALDHLQEAPAAEGAAARVGVLYNPADAAADPSLLARLLLATTQLTSRRPKIAGFLTALLSDPAQLTQLGSSYNSALELVQKSGLNLQAVGRALEDAQLPQLNDQLKAQAELTQKLLKVPAGSSAVVTNGRVVVVESAELGVSEEFGTEDFGLLELYANSQQSAAGIQALLETALTEGRAVTGSLADSEYGEAVGEGDEDMSVGKLSNAAMLASSILATHGAAEVSERNQGLGQAVNALQGHYCAITGHSGGGARDTAPSYLHVDVVLNPLSKAAQRVAPILEWLRSSFHASIKVYLNPERELSDMPLKTFYRYVLPEPSPAGGMPQPPAAVFKSLPPHQILTLNFDAPEMWLVEPVVAEHDLDNLKLEQLGNSPTLSAEYELEALMLTGRCMDLHARRRELVTPRGVQLHLGSHKQPHLQDTLVMSNLGYFQLKSAPGAWTLQLAPGRSRELYHIESSTGTVGNRIQAEAQVEAATLNKDYQTAVAIGSLQGKDMLLRITKRPGFELDDVLDSANDEKSESLWGRLTSWASKPNPLSESALGTGVQRSAQKQLSPEEDPDTIHIFSVASGHMYERLQKIMILSVIRTTKNPVKFWFIKNYMSPQMKRFVPEMAAHYNFHYQFVTYKWPSFLHKQTEKQRLIWAYKILFLDVLFPLNLRKVIFCDSDQVVRGNMAELWNMDLKGAPFGFTPFCDNNKDMEGFRFWKQGFWKEHLRGKPYHISALFVVDLARFRQTAAGDQLRVVYEQLSKDPNSLSNLDQDLPNYAQHSVPIHSLPMEWLWCETWCGNSTKEYAKTIDLCNNPLTKEPKLQGARRIVSEWPALDEEARSFTSKVEAQMIMSLESFESQNQQQAEIQQDAASTMPSDANPGELESHSDGDGGDIPTTLQYLAQQAEINHAFQEQVKSQRQEKSEL